MKRKIMKKIGAIVLFFVLSVSGSPVYAGQKLIKQAASDKEAVLVTSEKNKIKTLTQTILKENNFDGPRVVISSGPQETEAQAAFVPKEIKEAYTEQVFKSYIVELEEVPLLQKTIELNPQLFPLQDQNDESDNELSVINKKGNFVKSLFDNIVTSVRGVKGSIAAHQAAIEREQVKAEQVVKSISKNAKVTKKFQKIINGISVENIGVEEVKKLQSEGYKVWPNIEVKALLSESVPQIKAPLVWQEVKDKNGNPVTGKGVRVGVIDTGVDYMHPDLGGCYKEKNNVPCKVKGGYDFVNNDEDPMDDHGHGTHVASIAAGNGALKGVAPDAEIYAYKVLDAGGSGYESNVIAGIERAMDPDNNGDFSDHLDVINLSLAGYGDPSDPMSKAIDRVAEVGVVPVVAAGNSGMYGMYTVMSPGTAKRAITVGAVTKQDALAWFSSRGPVVWQGRSIMKPDVTAPGDMIRAARAGGSDYVSYSGTSMATPHVTGAAALLKQLNPTWNPRQIKSALKNTAQKQINVAPYEQGTGRIDAREATRIKNRPIVAELFSLPWQIQGQVTVKGVGWAPNLKKYSVIAIGITGSASGETMLLESTSTIVNNTIGEVNFNRLADGKYILKFVVENANGDSGVDYGMVEVNKLKITNPQGSDVLRAGTNIGLSAWTSPSLADVPLKWSFGEGYNPATWTDIASTTWNTALLESGAYTVRVSANHDNMPDAEFVHVYLDKTLKKGFPKRVRADEAPCPDGYSKCFYWQGALEPVVSDINNDGKKEIIIFKSGHPPKLIVYRSNGTIMWEVPVGSAPGFGNMGVPIVGDINGDGSKEIFVVHPGDFESFVTYSELYAFNSNGEPLEGWSVPLQIPQTRRGKMLMADVDRDGKKEIVIQPTAQVFNPKREMVIVGHDGSIKKQWEIPEIHWATLGGPENYPAVGNFDEDADLEIVAVDPSPNAMSKWENGNFIGFYNEGIIHVWNSDGSYVSGWPRYIQGILPLNASPSVSDIDEDGWDDIVLPTWYPGVNEPTEGGIYAFKRNGDMITGWPQKKGVGFTASAAITDTDKDGDLDIAVSPLEQQTYVLNKTGQVKPGWPKYTSWYDWYGAVSANVDNDPKPDVLVSAASIWGGGGVYAWRGDGSLIPGFPKGTELDAQASPVVTDLEGDGKLEVVASSDWDMNMTEGRYKMRGSVYVWELPEALNDESNFWPMYRHDEENTGRLDLTSFFQVTSPKKGEKYEIGDKVPVVNIEWTPLGVPKDEVVNIELWKTDKKTKVTDIVLGVEVTQGKYAWNIGAGIMPGQYLVKVITKKEAEIIERWSKMFEITSRYPAASISVQNVTAIPQPVVADQDFVVDVVLRNYKDVETPVSEFGSTSMVSASLVITDVNEKTWYNVGRIFPSPIPPMSTGTVRFSTGLINPPSEGSVLKLPSGEYNLEASVLYLNNQNKNTKLSRKLTVVDKTPRIAFWPGKVNEYVNRNSGLWTSDEDGIAGADFDSDGILETENDRVAYCKYHYPSSYAVEPYKVERIKNWRASASEDDPVLYEMTAQTYRCKEHLVTVAPDRDTRATSTISMDKEELAKVKLEAPKDNMTVNEVFVGIDSDNMNILRDITVSLDGAVVGAAEGTNILVQEKYASVKVGVDIGVSDVPKIITIYGAVASSTDSVRAGVIKLNFKEKVPVRIVSVPAFGNAMTTSGAVSRGGGGVTNNQKIITLEENHIRYMEEGKWNSEHSEELAMAEDVDVLTVCGEVYPGTKKVIQNAVSGDYECIGGTWRQIVRNPVQEKQKNSMTAQLISSIEMALDELLWGSK